MEDFFFVKDFLFLEHFLAVLVARMVEKRRNILLFNRSFMIMKPIGLA